MEGEQPKEEQPKEEKAFEIREMTRIIQNRHSTAALTFKENLVMNGFREISIGEMLVSADGEHYIVEKQDKTKFRKDILDLAIQGVVSFLREDKPTGDRVKKFLAYAAVHYRPECPLVIEVGQELCLLIAPVLED